MADSNRCKPGFQWQTATGVSLVFNGRQQPQLLITEPQHSKAGKPREKGDKHQQVKPACQQGTANSKASLPACRTPTHITSCMPHSHTHTTSLTPTTHHLPHTHITSLTLTHTTSLTPTPPWLTPPPLTQYPPPPPPCSSRRNSQCSSSPNIFCPQHNRSIRRENTSFSIPTFTETILDSHVNFCVPTTDHCYQPFTLKVTVTSPSH